MTIADRRNGWIVLVAIALVAMLFGVRELGARKGSGVTVPTRSSVETRPAPVRATVEAEPVRSSTTRPVATPFAFLGKVTEAGQTHIVLHGSGRVFKVRGAGPLADGWVVDLVQDELLVVRYVPSGERQILALASYQQGAPAPGGSPEETPQD
jgi:hypothetical protein